MLIENSEGPYESIDFLKRNSTIFKNLFEKYGDKVNIIFEDRLIFTPVSHFQFPKNGFPLDFIEVYNHTVLGDFNRTRSSGGHFYQENKIRIVEQLAIDSKNVVRALIEIYNPETLLWVKKNEPTTLFPLSWTFQKYINEAYFCYNNMDDKGFATTSCGIATKFLFDKKGGRKSFYPILSITQ